MYVRPAQGGIMEIRLPFVMTVCVLLAASVPFARAQDESGSQAVTLRYIGHSCVQLTAADGTVVVADPYGFSRPSGLEMVPKGLAVAMVTVSHNHPDHSGGVVRLGAAKKTIDKPGFYTVGPFAITGYESDHGVIKGVSQGNNTVFIFKIAGIRIVHLGAAGIIGQADILQAVKGADVAVMDVGGDDAHPLKEMVEQITSLGVHTIIPGHYSLKADSRYYGAPTVDEFIQLAVPKEMKVERTGSEVALHPGMPDRILVMTPAALSGR
jgi:L-ascorbate metabolism protein UlaG (beta-lactamase superfamily)